jgi:hypothetical protein
MPEEIMEVLRVCVTQGIQALNFGIPILAEELEPISRTGKVAKRTISLGAGSLFEYFPDCQFCHWIKISGSDTVC